MRAAAELGGAKVAGGKVAWWAAAQAAERAEAASADRQGAFWGLGAAASARAVGQGREHAEVSKEVAVEAEAGARREVVTSAAARSAAAGMAVEAKARVGSGWAGAVAAAEDTAAPTAAGSDSVMAATAAGQAGVVAGVVA